MSQPGVQLDLTERRAHTLGLLVGAIGGGKRQTKLRPKRAKQRVVERVAEGLGAPRFQRGEDLQLTGKLRQHALVVSASSPELPSRLAELSDELFQAFVRGLFEAAGRLARYPAEELSCHLEVRRDLAELLQARYPGASTAILPERRTRLAWHGANALDLLGALYETANVFDARMRRRYLTWCGTLATSEGELQFHWCPLSEEAVAPFKPRVSDSGYDLTLLREVKRFGRCILFGTGIQIRPPHGWYFDVVPRSSIIKLGYIAANSVGVIDRSYRGEIMVPLIKLDETVPELELPARVAQLIPRPIVHMTPVRAGSLDTTARGGGGFGSSGP